MRVRELLEADDRLVADTGVVELIGVDAARVRVMQVGQLKRACQRTVRCYNLVSGTGLNVYARNLLFKFTVEQIENMYSSMKLKRVFLG